MIHIFRRKSKFAITHTIFRETNKETKVESEKEYKFQNFDDAAVFLHRLYKVDIGIIACFCGEDEFHCTSTNFYYGMKYAIEHDDIKISAEVNSIKKDGSKFPLYIAKDAMTVLKLGR